MSAYCQVSDVQSDFKSISFTSGSNVTDAAVTGFITEASALIDSYVGQRWVTPISGDAGSLALMSLYCRTLVSERIRGIMANKQTTNADANQEVRGVGYKTSDVMQALKDISTGLIQLSGASLVNANASFKSNNFDRGIQARFHKNRRQW